ncbi:hypothetical protein KCV87_30460 [Actinosynnema pretiosum subsp. pretiosum]|uniref:Uncharacterized protein n=1 Tax=Actinosynnema pretiosum subsp. pretiosum TaxID=103721 RepID=A0AA45L6A9_9PSEU|nr:hypothetical protein APASM_5049 [Actinosynnema pretiosum subsp. pretiosum]QUF03658.1 hypothetical protein KCV87_30460 [Actinosynnema pretiosum subsp. pretiosum]
MALVATADITFQAASGAHLKGLLPAVDLLRVHPPRVHHLDRHDRRTTGGRPARPAPAGRCCSPSSTPVRPAWSRCWRVEG